MNILTASFFAEHGTSIVLGGLLFLQWVAFQALLIHYHFFRKSLVRPRPDGIRMSIMERTIKFQAEQLESLFAKLAETKREFLKSERDTRGPTALLKDTPTSMESSFATMGEISLKKRIAELKSRTN